MYVTLYARALNNKIKIWRAEETTNGILIQSGYFNGNLSNYLSKITMASSNSQFLSMVKKKKREGYKDINDIINLISRNEFVKDIPIQITEERLNKILPDTNLDDNYNLKPMKCQKFRKGKMQYPAIAQPKYNGVRAVLRWESKIISDGLFTRNEDRAVIRSQSGLEYHFPHITNDLTRDMFVDKETGLLLAFDGELYTHNTPLNIINSACPLINDNGVIAKTNNPLIYSNISFIIFDLPIEDISQANRIKILDNFDFTDYQRLIPTFSIIVNNDDEVMDYTLKCINNGYEGCIVRNIEAEYAFGSRPMTIMKSKQYSDAEFEIIDIISNNDVSDGSDIRFVLKNDINDEIFECVPMYTLTERITMLRNKESYIGKVATVKFYERSGVKQVPFHANVITIRDYE